MNMIFKRTSVRKYTKEAVSTDQTELLLKAGMAAPSARNLQPWEFVLVQKRQNLDKLIKIHPNCHILKTAPLAIMVCADTKVGDEEFARKNFWIQDCSAATQNIMLQAAEMDLGSVWIGTYPKLDICEEIKKEFNLPQNVMPVTIIAIGHHDEEIKPKNKFDKSKIHYEEWRK